MQADVPMHRLGDVIEEVGRGGGGGGGATRSLQLPASRDSDRPVSVRRHSGGGM